MSPRAAEVKFISHHAFALIAGSLLAAIALAALTLVLLLLFDADALPPPGDLAAGAAAGRSSAASRSRSSASPTRSSRAIETHKFAVGHDLTNHAVDQALTKSTPNVIVAYIGLSPGWRSPAGMIATMLNSLRVGLLPRWMGILGMFTALLIFLPIGGAELQIVPAFWMVMMGILLRRQMARRRSAGVGRRRGAPVAAGQRRPRQRRRRAGAGRRRGDRPARGERDVGARAAARDRPRAASGRGKRRKRKGALRLRSR